MIRTYARIVAVVLIALAFLGLAVLGWSMGDIIYHGGLGLLFAIAGFWQRDATTVRMMVGGLGGLGITIKAVELLGTWVLPAVPLYLGPHEITCITVGIASLLAARYLPDASEAPSKNGGGIVKL